MTASRLTLRTALPLKAHLSEYDPVGCYMAYDWQIFHATLRALAEVNENGVVIPAVAQAFYWRGEELIFEFDPRFRTVDGLKITADDAALSLKRTMILKSNYRGYLDNLLDVARLRGLDDDIPQIRVEGDKLVLRPMTKSPIILEVLANLDFAIYPRSAIDPDTLTIRDFRNTTGAYYVAGFDDVMILKANMASRHYSPDMPQEIRIMRDARGEDGRLRSVAAFKGGELDFIPYFSLLKAEDSESLAALPNVVSHRTPPLSLVVGNFTPKGRQRSAAERRHIARQLQESAARRAKNPFVQPTIQLFPEDRPGALDPTRLKVLVEDALVPLSKDCRDVIVSVPEYALENYRQRFLGVPFPVRFVAQTEEHLDFASFQGGHDEPDMVLIGLDLRHETEISFLAFSLNTGVFGLTRVAAEKWLTDYACELDADKRREMTRALHFRALYTDPSAIPFFAARFVAVARGGWNMNFPGNISLAPFWKLRKDASH